MSFAFCRVQEGFKITAEISGVPDGKMLLISERGDILATTNMVGGKFEFSGRVDRAMVAYIMTADAKARIPLMIENTVFNVVANESLMPSTQASSKSNSVCKARRKKLVRNRICLKCKPSSHNSRNSWCNPCRQENPNILKLYPTY